ncbi:MAG: hypothetical protein ACM3PX_08180 [Omnitrophica WOR_2 bacterium]
MQDIEPFYAWEELYNSSLDERSPFFGREYNDIAYTNVIYNYYIHPRWDEFGSATLYSKVLFVDYHQGYAIIELLGEWNDCLYNDIMYFKRNVIEPMLREKINKFILIGENVLNFHFDDDSYYQEWFEDLEDGWIAMLNFREHVLDEFYHGHLDYYLNLGGLFNTINWRTLLPKNLFLVVDQLIMRKLDK